MHVYRFEAMSTPCELHIYTAERTRADAAAQAVVHETKRLEGRYNYYHPDSIVTALNTRSQNRLDTETAFLLRQAQHFYRRTNGAFDITLATLKTLQSSAKTLEEFAQQKERLLPYVGCEHFTIAKGKIRFDNPHTQIDLGGFVKEYAVDRAVGILRKHRIHSALVNFGGDLFALGAKPDATPFVIGIKDPLHPTRIARHLPIVDQALTTSASYERPVRIGSEIVSHVLSRHEKAIPLQRSVTAIAPSCLESGVCSTALLADPDLQPFCSVNVLP